MYHIIEDDNENSPPKNDYEITWLGDGFEGGFILNDNYCNLY